MGFICCAVVLSMLYGGTPAVCEGAPSNLRTHLSCSGEWFKEAEFFVERGLIPGALIVVKTPEWGLRIGSVGYADISTGTPHDPGMRYHVGGVTQIMLSTIVLQLEHEGKVTLDSPIDRLLGEGLVPNGNVITLRDCLMMRSGLFDYSQADIFKLTGKITDANYSPTEILYRVRESLRKESQNPGSGFSYSYTGFLLVGMVVESIEKKHLGQVFEERIFKPLGMKDSFFATSADITGLVAHGYENMSGIPVDCTSYGPSTLGAACAVVSTPFDILRFFRELFEGRSLLTARSHRLMTTLATTLDEEDTYGLGLMERLSRRGTWRGCETFIRGYSVMAGYYMQGQAYIMVFVNTGENGFAVEEIFRNTMRRISGCPTDMSPANGAVLDSDGGSVRLTWQSGFIYGDKYRVFIGDRRKIVHDATVDKHEGVTMIETDFRTFHADVKNLKTGKTYYWRVETFREVPETELENARLWRDHVREQNKQMPWFPVPEFESVSGPDYSFKLR